ncbi:MAG: amino acid-binding protein [Clostridia bacterium]|nr:amino acid-binding protein [Clostridia bacterium]
MKIKQLTVFVENRTGYLSEITDLLGKSGVDMKALSIADTKDFGILRLIVSDEEKAVKVLNDNGVICKLTDVIGVKIPNAPGSLSTVLSLLAANGVNVEYLYAFLSGSVGGANVVFKATDNDIAEKILLGNGYKGIEE